MQKRRERIEKWRQERKTQEMAEVKVEPGNINFDFHVHVTNFMPIFLIATENQQTGKKWSLEDEDEEEEAEAEAEAEDEIEPEADEPIEVKMDVAAEDDVDPLDAFMEVNTISFRFSMFIT